MKVLGVIGSPRKKGNTDVLVSKVLEGASSCGIETHLIYLCDYTIHDCTGCEGCQTDCQCIIKDGMQEIYPLIENTDALVIGSPTYFYDVTGIMKNFLDRLYCYELFDRNDRSVWMGINEVIGQKFAVTVAVCEQKNETDMGCTTLTMNRAISAIGYRVVEEVRAYHSFTRGEVLKNEKCLENATEAGIKLARYLLLHRSLKKRFATGHISGVEETADLQ